MATEKVLELSSGIITEKEIDTGEPVELTFYESDGTPNNIPLVAVGGTPSTGGADILEVQVFS